MSKANDFTGKRFGMLTAIERTTGTKKSTDGALWLCKCDCGKMAVVSSQNLRRGRTKSCGCLKKIQGHKLGSTANLQHGGTHTRLFSIWHGMKCRCYLPTHKYFKYYGGKGIAICEEWISDFAAFEAWALSNGYTDELTIDRIDNNKGYSPDNCRWVTMAEQNRNKGCLDNGRAE